MTNITYQIQYTDTSITGKEKTILIPANQTSNDTSLTMHGYGSTRYGEDIWKNMLHMMEHFCSWSKAPDYPTEGQLWYRASTKQLLLYTKDSKNAFYWRSVIAGTGFDPVNDGINLDSEAVTLGSVKQMLENYINYKKFSSEINAELKVAPSYYSSWITVESGKQISTLPVDVDKNKLAPKQYVDIAIKTAIDSAKKSLIPVGTGTASPNDVIHAASLIDSSAQPFILRDGKDDITRTMTKPLFLRSQSGNSSLELNEAVSFAYLDAKLNGSGNVLNYENVLKICTDKVTSSQNEFPFISKNLEEKLTQYLYLSKDINFDTDERVLVNKKYVDSKLGIATDVPVLGPQNNASFGTMPDGTKMVYGNGHQHIELHSGDNWYYSLIKFPTGGEFINSLYSVTITENVINPTTAAIAYPQPHILSATNNPDINKVMWPLTFKVYNKTPTQFEVAIFVPSGLDSAYKKSISFDFVAVGK
jgi:hypothetical protein